VVKEHSEMKWISITCERLKDVDVNESSLKFTTCLCVEKKLE
jgi:hypothetical protein